MDQFACIPRLHKDSIMKRTIALLGMTLAVCALAGAQENTGNRVVVPARNGGRPRTVEANLLRGSINVKTGGGEIIAEIPGAPSRREANVPPGMHRIDAPWREGLQVEESGDVVQISLAPPQGGPLTLTVPVNTSLKLHTTHGEITVTGV